MDMNLITTNLVRLRKNRSLTQVQIAEASNLSRSAYRAIEKGHAQPGVESLRAIAAALDVPIRELVTPAPNLKQVRFRSLKRLKSRDQILVAVATWLADFNELGAMLKDQQTHSLAPLYERVSTLSGQGIEVIAAAAREYFGLSPREPVHDICGLLESQGIKVHQVQVNNDAFLGLSVAASDGGPAIVVNTWERLAVEHWIYSAVHELGHLLLHLSAYDVGLLEEEEAQEREAETFASHFLMPAPVFWREWDDTAGYPLLDRVLKVKRVFRVSWRAVVYRASERLPPDERGTLWRQINREYKRRTKRPLLKLTEPGGIDGSVFKKARLIAQAGAEPAKLDAHDFQGDRLALLIRRAIEQEHITLSRGAEILGLTIDQMRERATSWVL